MIKNMEKEYLDTEIVVIGGGPGGLAAAITASRAGAKVTLIERNGYLGGQLGSGLPFLAFWDKKGRQVISGIAQEFVNRLEKEGASFGHEYCPHHLSTTLIHPFYSRIIAFQMCKESNVEVLMHCELSKVNITRNKIESVEITGKGHTIEISSKVFIDGTGDGDLAFMAGAEYEKGQEGSGVLQPPTLMFNLGGVNIDEFCDFIKKHPEELPYDVLDNIEEGYNAEFLRNDRSFIFIGMHHLLEKLRKEGRCPIDRETIIFIRQPNPNEVAINTIRILNFDGSDIHDLSRGEMEAHLQIPKLIKMFKDEVPGFENCFLTSINANIGVRESRRIKGIKYLQEKDVTGGSIPEDSIALCSYFIDVHNGAGQGTYRVPIEKPFGIPYGCLISKNISNLIVSGRCISTDSLVFGATRIMNVCMAVGQAAGEAAGLSIKINCEPSRVDIGTLQKKLIDGGAILKID